MTAFATPSRAPRIAVMGPARWIEDEDSSDTGQIAGSAAMAAIVASRLGADVAIVSKARQEHGGDSLVAGLRRSGVDSGWLNLERDSGSSDPPRLVRGDRLDIYGIFTNDLVLLDIEDPPLRRVLTDLPAHTAPNARLLGTVRYLIENGMDDAGEIALRHDAIIGTELEFQRLTSQNDWRHAASRLQASMPGSNLRTALIFRGDEGSCAFTRDQIWEAPACAQGNLANPEGESGFEAACAFGMALRWPWPEVIRFGNAAAVIAATDLIAIDFQSVANLANHTEAFA